LRKKYGGKISIIGDIFAEKIRRENQYYWLDSWKVIKNRTRIFRLEDTELETVLLGMDGAIIAGVMDQSHRYH